MKSQKKVWTRTHPSRRKGERLKLSKVSSAATLTCHFLLLPRDNLAKVLFQPKVPEDELPEKPASEEHQGRERNGISNEWEVVDGPEQETNTSPSPEIIKKTPPTIKEKPRKTADQPAKDKSGEVEAKKTPLIPSEHLTSLASILQKGPTKPGKVSFP